MIKIKKIITANMIIIVFFRFKQHPVGGDIIHSHGVCHPKLAKTMDSSY